MWVETGRWGQFFVYFFLSHPCVWVPSATRFNSVCIRWEKCDRQMWITGERVLYICLLGAIRVHSKWWARIRRSEKFYLQRLFYTFLRIWWCAIAGICLHGEQVLLDASLVCMRMENGRNKHNFPCNYYYYYFNWVSSSNSLECFCLSASFHSMLLFFEFTSALRFVGSWNCAMRRRRTEGALATEHVNDATANKKLYSFSIHPFSNCMVVVVVVVEVVVVVDALAPAVDSFFLRSSEPIRHGIQLNVIRVQRARCQW